MQSKLDSSSIKLDPPDTLEFKPSHTSKPSTSLLIKNLSENTIAFRVRVSTPKEFIVTPVNGVISASSYVNINITFAASADRKNAGQKFSIECCQAPDVSLADWKGKAVQFKLTTRFEADVQEVQVRERNRDEEESFNEFASFAYSEHKEEVKDRGIEQEKKELTVLNSEICEEIRKLQILIEDASHKLKFSKDIDLIAKEIGGKYTIPHLALLFVVGMVLGFYVLA